MSKNRDTAKSRLAEIFGSKDKTKKPNPKKEIKKKSLAEQINFGGKKRK